MQKGIVRKRRGQTKLSEYGKQLQEKQTLRREYNLKEGQFRNYIKAALKEERGGTAVEVFLQKLERRLDNVAYRAGLAQTRAQARQMVSHGHFLVNGRKVTVPSLQVRRGDTISVRPSSLDSTLLKNAKLQVKKYETPSWIQLDKETLAISIIGVPLSQELALTVDIPLIFAFYSR